MQNSLPKLRQNCIITEKTDNLKTLASSNYHKLYIFLLKFFTHFLLNNVYKMVLGIFFLFYFILVCKNQVFLIFTNRKILEKSYSKQNKKNPEHPFVDIDK